MKVLQNDFLGSDNDTIVDMKRNLIWVILVIAFLFRFVSVGSLPKGFNADEASFGYDSYSILHTGKDQWGKPFPLVLKSFGDYKSPVYSYLAIPSIALFGLNIFATRLPNVIVGTMAVYAVYLLVGEMVRNFKWLAKYRISTKLNLLAALLLAVNPWSVMMSRGAVEANLISFFLPIGIYFFLLGLGNYKYFTWSVIGFGIGMFTYHSAKMLIPIIFAGLVIVFRTRIREINSKKIIFPFVLFSVFMIGMLYTFSIGGGARVSERSITQGALEQGFQERVASEAKGLNPKIAKLVHNRYQVILNRFFTNYSQYFSVRFLVGKGVNDASYAMIPGIGVIYVLELILLLGIVPLLLIEKKSGKIVLALICWLLISPLPAALASGGGYSGNRAGGMLPVLQICEAFGLVGWIAVATRFNKNYENFVLAACLTLLAINTFSFKNTYFATQPISVIKQQGYGNLDLGKWLNENTLGRHVIISRSISEAQIFIAFASKWEPIEFQKITSTWKFDEAKISWVDQLPKYNVGRYTITSIDWKKDDLRDSMVVVKADELPQAQIPTKTFYYPNGDPNVYVVDLSKNIYAKAY